ncbi:MAG: ribonuclease H [Candidatus Hinthialibacteria bacterium]|nr:ribonuclease HI [bacterium]MBV6482037.1 Ribonuclease H [bacterium]MCC6733627.1 ribonuclease HI [Candidatus Omnitrophota bacterium]
MGLKKEITIYTDGACQGNPGPGGWAAILSWDGHVKEISGYAPQTTNNRMELQAAIEALRLIKKKTIPIRIVTDSKYLQEAFTKNWIHNWVRNGWKTASKAPVKNQDLWEDLVLLSSTLPVSWHWTQGHASDAMNNRCDELARLQIEKHHARR